MPPTRAGTQQFSSRLTIMTQPKLLDRVRAVARLRHLSLSTERTYSEWIKRFIL